MKKTLVFTPKKTWIYILLLFLFQLIGKAQIITGNCYQFVINGSYLDYNPTIDSKYLYGRTDVKTSTFKVETAPAPNNTFYTIKTVDGKYLSIEQGTNKILLKNNLDDANNQVFDIRIKTNGLYIYTKNAPFGASAMQWRNNEKAFILGNQGSWITLYNAATCVTNSSGDSGGTITSSWPKATIGEDNIINPNKGGVIIGTGISSAPIGYKLYVSDGILTEQLVVTPKTSMNWADFVFDKNYQLKSIPELKRYINKHKHLPDISTTSDVLKNGINLGENAAKLLQKIEELTLYLIQHEAKINSLASKIKDLEAKRKEIK